MTVPQSTLPWPASLCEVLTLSGSIRNVACQVPAQNCCIGISILLLTILKLKKKKLKIESYKTVSRKEEKKKNKRTCLLTRAPEGPHITGGERVWRVRTVPVRLLQRNRNGRRQTYRKRFLLRDRLMWLQKLRSPITYCLWTGELGRLAVEFQSDSAEPQRRRGRGSSWCRSPSKSEGPRTSSPDVWGQNMNVPAQTDTPSHPASTFWFSSCPQHIGWCPLGPCRVSSVTPSTNLNASFFQKYRQRHTACFVNSLGIL